MTYSVGPKDNCEKTVLKPIKIVDHNNKVMGLKEKAVIGLGTITCVVAILQFTSRSLSQHCVYPVLLHSRSNEDLSQLDSNLWLDSNLAAVKY